VGGSYVIPYPVPSSATREAAEGVQDSDGQIKTRSQAAAEQALQLHDKLHSIWVDITLGMTKLQREEHARQLAMKASAQNKTDGLDRNYNFEETHSINPINGRTNDGTALTKTINISLGETAYDVAPQAEERDLLRWGMRANKGQRHSIRGVWQVARSCRGGVNNSRKRIENLQPMKILQHKEIIAGIGYDLSLGKVKRHCKQNGAKRKNEVEDDDNETDTDIKEEERQRAEKESSRRFVPRLGNMRQDRPEEVFRLLGGNLNSASSREVRNRKISDIMKVIETWDAQTRGFLEVDIAWRNVARSKQINSWFRLETDSYRTSVANNHQEAVPTTTRQQGGIALFAGKEVRQYISKTKRDFRGLGRWNLWLIQSDPSHRTKMVVAYQVGQAR
jgi:hypothetical protein